MICNFTKADGEGSQCGRLAHTQGSLEKMQLSRVFVRARRVGSIRSEVGPKDGSSEVEIGRLRGQTGYSL